MIDIEPIRRRYLAAAPFLDERGRRVLAAAEAKAAGPGGISAVAKATGVARSTIRRGLADVAVGVGNIPGRVRRPGGGRRSAEQSQPGLLKALEGLVDGAIRGDPESPLRWVSRGQRRLSRELAAGGFRASQRTVARLLRGLGFSLQANRKTREGGVHPDHDEQFQTINRLILSHQADGQPAISVDTKKKELVGDFKNGGRELRPTGEPEAVRVHDFEDKGLGKVVPYGVYDIAANKGWVRLGVDNDTAAFAVETIRRAAGGRRSATRGIPAPGAFSSLPTVAARTARGGRYAGQRPIGSGRRVGRSALASGIAEANANALSAIGQKFDAGRFECFLHGLEGRRSRVHLAPLQPGHRAFRNDGAIRKLLLRPAEERAGSLDLCGGDPASDPTMLRHLLFRIVGAAPLVMHGMALPESIHPASRDLARLRGKRGKTQTDDEKIAELEWRSSLWLDAGELVIPAQIIHAAFRDSAEAHGLGGIVAAGFRCRNSPWLQHDGGSSPTHLWADHRRRLRMPVWTGGVRAMRTLPVFPEWAADIEVHFCPMRLNAEKVLDLFRHAGEHIGIGGGRPRFGRFVVKAI